MNGVLRRVRDANARQQWSEDTRSPDIQRAHCIDREMQDDASMRLCYERESHEPDAPALIIGAESARPLNLSCRASITAIAKIQSVGQWQPLLLIKQSTMQRGRAP